MAIETDLRFSRREIGGEFVEGAKNSFAWNILHNLVDFNPSNEVGNAVMEQMAKGNMPCVISNHEGHGDGIPFAVAAEYMMALWSQIGRDHPSRFPLRGFVAPMARSWATGHQGDHLKNSYELLNPAAQRMGLFTMPHTRPKDIRKYGLPKELLRQERNEFEVKLNDGFAPMVLPAASVQGGRHPEGASMEDIYGMPLIKNNVIRDCYEAANNAASNLIGGESFFVPLALHGSFRYVRTEGDNEPKLTSRGILSLALGAVGLPLVLPKMQAKMLMPLTNEKMKADLGSDWLKDSMALNGHIMRLIAAALPPQARGAYR